MLSVKWKAAAHNALLSLMIGRELSFTVIETAAFTEAAVLLSDRAAYNTRQY